MPTPAERAVDVFSKSYNCSQAVFSAFAPGYGMDTETALKLASPFGAGLARHGEVCGAVSGALLVLGLARGADQPAGKEEVYRLSQEFMHRFEQKHGSVTCRVLIGHDLSTPEGWEKAREANMFTTICPVLVRDAAEILQTLLR
jgi:C_GCAxxG_C_C family probable redox protein